MPYTPPNWDAADIDFGAPYTSPVYNGADIEFSDAAFSSLYPSGIAPPALDAPFLVYQIYVTGIAPTDGYGTAVVYNYNQEITTTGIAPTDGYGTAVVYNYVQYITGTGFTSLAFGTTVIDHVAPPSYITISVGIDGFAYGTAHVYGLNQFIDVPSVGVTDVYGVAYLENLNREILQSSFLPTEFGTAVVYNLTQYITGTGWQDDAFGTAEVMGPRYIHPGVVYGYTIFGFTTVGSSIRYLTLAGDGPPLYQVPEPNVSYINRYIFAEGIEPPEMFGAIVAMPPFDIIDVLDNSIPPTEEFGDANVYFSTYNHIHLTSGIAPGSFGTARLTPHTIWPAGKAPGSIGTAVVQNKNRYIRPNSTAMNFFRAGNHLVGYYIRNVYPVGWDSQTVWSDFGPINIDDTIPGVKSVAVPIAPDGFEASGVTYDNCGFPRTPQVPRPSVAHV